METLIGALPQIRSVIDGGLVVLIWLVQLIIYPVFHQIEAERLRSWHAYYVRRMGRIVGPMMLLQVAVVLTQLIYFGGILNLLSGCLVLGCWVCTALFSIPCHRKIEQGKADSKVLSRLVITNWPRTILWTAVFAVGLF